MPPVPKPPIISKKRSEAICAAARARPGLQVRRNPENRGEVRAHHLRPVFSGQSRRSNPIVVDLYDSEHEFIHDNPEYEEKIRQRLLLRALDIISLGDIEVIEAAMRGAITYIQQREAEDI